MVAKIQNISIKNCFGVISVVFVIFVLIPTILWSQSVQNRIFPSSHGFLTQKDVIPVNINIKWQIPYIDVWRQWKHRSKILPENLVMFKMVMTEEDLNVTINLLEAFARTMDKHNLTYFMAGGTLLGSYRHHGLIPWDDDPDVMADFNQQKEVREALATIQDEYVVSEHSEGLLKLHSRNHSSFISESYAWKWPFIDIFWFETNTTHLHIPWGDRNYYIKDVFPLVERPFAGLKLKSPCNTYLYLNSYYEDLTECARPGWNHRYETHTGLEWKQIKCKDLEEYYPMVERKRTVNNTVLEFLRYKNQIISFYMFTENPH